MGFFDSCPGSERIKKPFPENIRCACGKYAEIWSDETETKCPSCGKTVNRKMTQSCLDWCKMAKDCVGTDKYGRYKKQKEA